MKSKFGNGDDGLTCFRGTKIEKNAPIIKLIGEIDELNSYIGLCRSLTKNEDVDKTLEEIQNKIFLIGAKLFGENIEFGKENTTFIEEEIKKYENELEPLKHFIYPTGTHSSSALQVARAICRRVERACVEAKVKDLIPFFNRLSDLLFVLARVENKRAGVKEKEWTFKK
ncbi:MAG: cob(I)yrinic acid a,c-diamide adenosyltransferase [Candidatus Aenigmatarchaeota archaeon]